MRRHELSLLNYMFYSRSYDLLFAPQIFLLDFLVQRTAQIFIDVDPPLGVAFDNFFHMNLRTYPPKFLRGSKRGISGHTPFFGPLTLLLLD